MVLGHSWGASGCGESLPCISRALIASFLSNVGEDISHGALSICRLAAVGAKGMGSKSCGALGMAPKLCVAVWMASNVVVGVGLSARALSSSISFMTSVAISIASSWAQCASMDTSAAACAQSPASAPSQLPARGRTDLRMRLAVLELPLRAAPFASDPEEVPTRDCELLLSISQGFGDT